MDNDLKVQFDALCDEFGMSTNTAFNIFARTVVEGRTMKVYAVIDTNVIVSSILSSHSIKGVYFGSD